jgi:hypothetical protein
MYARQERVRGQHIRALARVHEAACAACGARGRVRNEYERGAFREVCARIGLPRVVY